MARLDSGPRPDRARKPDARRYFDDVIDCLVPPSPIHRATRKLTGQPSPTGRFTRKGVVDGILHRRPRE